jgi:hypothetical protein
VLVHWVVIEEVVNNVQDQYKGSVAQLVQSNFKVTTKFKVLSNYKVQSNYKAQSTKRIQFSDQQWCLPFPQYGPGAMGIGGALRAIP